MMLLMYFEDSDKKSFKDMFEKKFGRSITTNTLRKRFKKLVSDNKTCETILSKMSPDPVEVDEPIEDDDEPVGAADPVEDDDSDEHWS